VAFPGRGLENKIKRRDAGDAETGRTKTKNEHNGINNKKTG